MVAQIWSYPTHRIRQGKFTDSEACESIGLREGVVCPLGELLEVLIRAVTKFPSLGLGSPILRSFTKSDANPSASAEFQAYLDHHDHAVKWAQPSRDLVAHRIKYFEKGPNPLDAEEGEDTNTPTISKADGS